jgi:hypothetical protein
MTGVNGVMGKLLQSSYLSPEFPVYTVECTVSCHPNVSILLMT